MRSGYTYPALVCDAADTLHLVARTHGLPYRLVYLSKASGRPWSEHQELIVPYSEEEAFYSIWYHKLNIDRKGRLFVSYQHYARPSSRDQAEAYLAKWPDDEITVNADGSLDWKRLTPHNPGMLLSDDGGRSWRLALTADFVAGVIR